MTERAPITGALPHQDPCAEGATLQETSLATHSTPLDITASEATPSESGTSNPVPASCERDDAGSQPNTISPPTAVIAFAPATKYRTAAVQTLPPRNAEQFHKIYDREPTNQELVSKTGSAALGRYGPGSSGNPHDVVLGAPFAAPVTANRRVNYTDSSFQTDDVAKCKKALLRAKVKASLLVNKQRDAAQSAGFRVWSETRDEYIVHSEQFHVSIQFDDQGNATNANVDGLSLPNIYGEEVHPPAKMIGPLTQSDPKLSYRKAETNHRTKYCTSTATSAFTPPPTPPSALLHNAVEGVSTPQRIRTVEPCVRSINSDPISTELYGYIQHVPREAIENDRHGNEGKNREQRKQNRQEVSQQAVLREQKDRVDQDAKEGEIVMMIGGKRFADQYIVFDATASAVPSPGTPTGTDPTATKKRKSEGGLEPEVAAKLSKRPKTTNTCTGSLEVGTSSQGNSIVQHLYHHDRSIYARGADIDRVRSSETPELVETRQAQSSPSHRTHNDDQDTEHRRYRRSSPTYSDYRRRSRSPVDQSRTDDNRSRSSTGCRPDSSYEEDRRNHRIACEMNKDSQKSRENLTAYTDEQSRSKHSRESDGQEMDVNEILSARKSEDDRRLEQQRRIEAEEHIKRRQLEEAEIQRARDAKNSHKLEIEEKRRAKEAARHRQEEETNSKRRRRRDHSEDRDRRESVKEAVKTPEQVDEYAEARKAEARRRELVFAARESGETGTRVDERAPARTRQSSKKEAEQSKPEKKVKEGRVTKPRPSRTARGELERYDPRKKFGGGR